jgi:tetratricopeptide (TPR) repeat protein
VKFRQLAIVALGIAADATSAQITAHGGHALGRVEFPISCSERSQLEFNHAMALLHHMTYPQAREAFQAIAAREPRCAMAHWGIAMTLFQPLWPTRPGPDALRAGVTATRAAEALKPSSERERLFIAGAAAFFGQPELAYWERIRRWEDAMAKVHAAFPQDPEAAAFYALAHLAVAPADRNSRAHADRAAGLLLRVYERNPEHPGAMHYLVHANDVPGRERELLDIVRKYETLAPRNPHALHMPTHIYTRLGDWEAVIRGNLRAADAALEHPAGDQGQYVWDEFPHAIEYLVYAHLQRGADDKAAAQLHRFRQTQRLEPSFKTAFHLASTQARYALERHDWREARSLLPRTPASLDWERFAWPEAVVWFARGLGAAHEGEIAEARAAAERLAELEAASHRTGEELFTRTIRVLRLAVRAWLAHADGAERASVSLMREAADLEASTPKHAVTPAPTLPAQELLGDLLLAQRDPAAALVAYERSLTLYPRRFNSLLGAARAARASGESSRARAFYLSLIELAAAGTREAALEEARTFASAAHRR